MTVATPVADKVVTIAASPATTPSDNSFVRNVVADVKKLEAAVANAWKNWHVASVGVLCFVAGLVVAWVL